MAYGLSNSHVIDDVMWSLKVLWSSTVGYFSDSLASCCLCCRRCLSISYDTCTMIACVSWHWKRISVY